MITVLDRTTEINLIQIKMGRHKRPSMIQITRKVHKNALSKVNEFIEKENQKELKKESKTKQNEQISN